MYNCTVAVFQKTPDEQREYLRILEKMATKQPVVTPTTGGMSEAAKRQRAIGDDKNGELSELQDSFKQLDSGEWEKVLDPMAIPLPPDYSQMVNKPLVERPGPFPSQLSPEADTARESMADSLCPQGVPSFRQWGKTMIKFGHKVRGRGYSDVCFSSAPEDIGYLKWARDHLVEPHSSPEARDFVKYLAAKDKFYGRSDRATKSVVYLPGSSMVRTYVD